MQPADVAQRRAVEPDGKRLVQNREKLGILVETILEAAGRRKRLDEVGVRGALAVGRVTNVARLRIEAPRVAGVRNR